MSDKDIRPGYRAMISGGMWALDQKEIENLIEVGQKALRKQNPGFLPADAEYLQQYTEICENFINARKSLRASTELLAELNKQFEDKISEKIKKLDVINPGIYMIEREEYEEYGRDWENRDEWECDGWMPSSIC